MTRVAALAALLLASAPRVADACPIKRNDLAIVLGMVNDDVVVARISLREAEDGNGLGSIWVATADLHIGKTKHAVGSLDPTKPAGAELDRLITAARDEARRLAGFVAATRDSFTDCSSKPSTSCGGAVLEKDATVLRVGSTRTTLPVADARRLTGVVRYLAGTTAITVANVGIGDPRWATSVKSCDGGCRAITTLHHGEQSDVVVVTR